MTRLLVASTGGHLTELAMLAPRLWPPDPDELWVTFDSEQSRSLLAGRRVQYIRNTPPRDWRSMLLNTGAAWNLTRRGVDSVVSNGAGIAVSFLPLATAKGISAHYIECGARVEGRSMSGRILEQTPGIKVYTQYPRMATSRWRYAGSSLDGFQSVEIDKPRTLRTVFVTVGTLDYSFIGLLKRLRTILPETVDVIVQAGTDTRRLHWPRATIRSKMSHEEIGSSIAGADVVVTHAGIGSALGVLDAGKVPVLVPRMQSRGEHVDDHQTQIAGHLADRELAVVADSKTITLDHIFQALRLSATQPRKEQKFVLQ